jgi:Ni/Co efflux regulator RcnB
MKRVALGALFVSLLAGSVAMAGQGYPGTFNVDRHNDHSDNRGRHDQDSRGNNRRDDNRHDSHDRRDPPRQNWDHGRNDHGRNDGDRNRGGNDWNRGHDRNDGNRGRNDWNRGQDRQDWNRGRDRQDWNGDHDRRDWNRGSDRRDWPRYNYAPPRHYSAPRYYAPPRHDWDRPQFHYGAYQRPWGYYPHSWARGERLPSAYYSRPYVVYDYDRCGLRSPPYGYNWVRVDNDVVLAAVATGVILDVIYNQFY